MGHSGHSGQATAQNQWVQPNTKKNLQHLECQVDPCQPVLTNPITLQEPVSHCPRVGVGRTLRNGMVPTMSRSGVVVVVLVFRWVVNAWEVGWSLVGRHHSPTKCQFWLGRGPTIICFFSDPELGFGQVSRERGVEGPPYVYQPQLDGSLESLSSLQS